jgi:hypothetical protein
MNEHGAKVMANLLLLVFYSLILVNKPGRSCNIWNDSSLKVGPKIEQFPSGK